MTNEEAILILRNEQPHCGGKYRFVEEQRYEAFDMAIKAIEQQTCEDAISRKALLEDLYKRDYTKFTHRDFVALVQYQDTVQPKHGDVISRNLITRTLNKMDRYVAEELTLCDTDKKFPKNEVFIVDDVYEQIVEQLPSAQSKTEVCEDAVSREAVIGLFAQNADAVRPYSKTWEEVKALPSVNPQPKTGQWGKMVEVYDLQQNRMLVPYGYDDAKFGNTPVYVCDCGCESNKNSRFCPDCGCRMVDK